AVGWGTDKTSFAPEAAWLDGHREAPAGLHCPTGANREEHAPETPRVRTGTRGDSAGETGVSRRFRNCRSAVLGHGRRNRNSNSFVAGRQDETPSHGARHRVLCVSLRAAASKSSPSPCGHLTLARPAFLTPSFLDDTISGWFPKTAPRDSANAD